MQRKQLVLTSLLLLVSGVRAEATTRTVKAGGGGDFTTIAACVTAMSSSGGDTCAVFAGTYNETPNIKAGTVGNYNVLTVNPGDTVKILGAIVNSHTKVNGFTIQNTSNPFAGQCVRIALSATDAFITNNSMSQCGGQGATEPGMIVSSRNGTAGGAFFIYIQGNTLTHGCSLLGVNDVCESISIDGDHFLIEGNDLSHNDDSIEFYASHVIARNNTFHDIDEAECNSASHGSNCHPDIFETEPNFGAGITHNSQHALFEGNTVKHMKGANAHIFLYQGDACGAAGNCVHAINRFNLFNDINVYMLNDLASFNYVKTYNDTQTPSVGTNLSSGCCNWSGATPGTPAVINALWYQYGTFSSTNWLYPSGSIVNHNNLINPSTSPFVDLTSNWALAPGSAAIGAGGSLTTAVGSGSSSSNLTLADAYYFQDGWGFPNGTGLGQVSPDWIRIGPSTTVQIANGGINYASGVITLASPVSWNNGAPIYLYKNSRGVVVLNGANPDLGAVPSGSSPLPPNPPTSLLAVIQ